MSKERLPEMETQVCAAVCCGGICIPEFAFVLYLVVF